MKVKVLIDTLNHNGRRRNPGELIEVDPAEAAQLIHAKAAEIVPEEKPAPFNPDGNKNPVSGSTDTATTTVQEQPGISAAVNSDADSGAQKSDKKDGKNKAK